ncbi:hypothetical protein [Spiroplasma endosymbiont of Dilophus febrilis]|uniref:hypothetical protein n=1 Tax=Spiroplasma endosymbiont of Dilophus febrilis TaxID=3066292 RepID=UPI00313C741C
MKKLLGILGTITIAGSGMVGLVGNAPSPTKNEINSLQKNNLESLNRNKRDYRINRVSDKNLSVPRIRQLANYWCGPAIAESILSYFGLNTNQVLRNVNLNRAPGGPFTSFQHYLANLMQTRTHRNLNPDLWQSNQENDVLGTSVDSWTSVMNDFIRAENLNSGRQYSINQINYDASIRGIENRIRGSLENGTPVALAYRGNLPQNYNLNSEIDNHFIIIYGVYGVLGANMHEINSSSVLTFRYMDPWTGTNGTVDASLIRTLISNRDNSGNPLTSFLISYDNSNVSTQTQISRPNQTEWDMEMGNCNIGPVSQFVRANFYCNIKTRTERSYLNNNLSCPSDSNPYYEYHGKDNTNNDYFKVTGKSGHDRVELKMSLKTAVAFENFFHQNNKLKIKNYLKNLINHVEQKKWNLKWRKYFRYR